MRGLLTICGTNPGSFHEFVPGYCTLINDYLEDELDPETKKEFELHIKGCAD
ncbi:MAG: zf-HC2 domain-containing protein [Nitrospinota bacterium]